MTHFNLKLFIGIAIIVILLCWALDVFGQGPNIELIDLKLPVKTDTTIHLVTVEDILQYEQECYNDSTLHYEYLGWGSCGYGNLEPVGEPINSYWIHKIPTFQGFIEFIKNRREIK